MARIALVHDIAGVAAVQADLLRGAGHEVDQIALPALGASWPWPAKAIALVARLVAYLPTVLRLRRANYDVVHIHWLTQGIVGVLSGRSFLVQVHGSDVHQNLDKPAYRWVNRSVLKHASTVLYVTPNLRQPLRDFGDKLFYLPNPVAAPDMGERPSPPMTVNKVLIFTRLDAIKGVDQIFPAVERLSQIADITGLYWGPLAREYVGRYSRWVRFVTPIPHAKIWSFLGTFDAVIGQMRQGILSLMEIEALAAGLPLITRIDPGLYEADPPPVIAASGADGIVAAIASLQGAPEGLAELSRRGREWAQRNHGYSRHLRLLQEAYFGPRQPEASGRREKDTG